MLSVSSGCVNDFNTVFLSEKANEDKDLPSEFFTNEIGENSDVFRTFFPSEKTRGFEDPLSALFRNISGDDSDDFHSVSLGGRESGGKELLFELLTKGRDEDFHTPWFRGEEGKAGRGGGGDSELNTL